MDDFRDRLKKGIAEKLDDADDLRTAEALIDRLCDALDEGVTDPAEIAELAVEAVAGSIGAAQDALEAAATVLKGTA